MRRGKLLMISLGVVIAGLLAALPYHRAPESIDSDLLPAQHDAALPLHGNRDNPANELVTLSISPTDDLHALAETSPAADYLRAAREREPMLELPQIRRDEALRSEAMVPELATNFRPFTETIRLLRDADASGQAAASPLTPVITTPPADLVIDDAGERPVRRHRIVDGDTLGSLAQRFYGEASLSSLLFDANRAILNDPEVLPLGTELEIPPQPSSDAPRGGILGVPQNISANGGESAPAISPLLTPIPAEPFPAG